jgi:peptide/nickel transport system permease protein
MTAPAGPAAADGPAGARPMGFAFWCAVGWLGGLAVAAVLVDVLPVRKSNDPDFLLGVKVGSGDWRQTFSASHPLGVDENGNDLLSYALHGARISLLVGVGTVAFALVVGGWLGMTAGYLRGPIESVLTFFTNAILSIPPLLFLLLLVSVLTAQSGSVSVWKFIFTLGCLTVPVVFRVVRAATLQQSACQYVLAARALGARRQRVLAREILPNVMKPALAYGLVAVGSVMVVEGTLSFLGAGLSGNTISWGRMLQGAAGLGKLKTGPHATFVPAGFLFLTVLSLNFVGDKARERMEVRQAAI